MDREELKKAAAKAAVELVQSGMVLGLGHGSTAHYALVRVAELFHSGAVRDIVAVPCSSEVEAEGRTLGIPLTTLEDHPVLDLTIDGADEVDPELNLIKGGGGALIGRRSFRLRGRVSRREGLTGGQRPIIGAILTGVVKMARWMRVSAVALAAMVGLAPMFHKTAMGSVLVVPVAEEIPDTELLEAEGEGVWLAAIIGGIIAGGTATAIYAVTTEVFSWTDAALVFAIGFAGGAAGVFAVHLFM